MSNIIINFLLIVLVTFSFDYFKSRRMYSQFMKEKDGIEANIEKIKVGDDVLVAGSIVGLVKEIESEYLIVSSADKTRIKVLRNTVIKI